MDLFVNTFRNQPKEEQICPGIKTFIQIDNSATFMEPSIEKQEAPSQEQDRNAKYKELYYQHVPKLVRQGVLEKM